MGDFLKNQFRAHRGQLQGTNLLIVQHVRTDTIELLLALREAGVKILALLGPEYSHQPAALEQARTLGFETVVAPFTELPALVHRFAAAAVSEGYAIVDTGGYAATVADDGLEFRVEMTNHGLWRYQNGRYDRVVEMAATTNKSIENIFIGAAIANAVKLELGLPSFAGCRVGVVGYGGIGSSVAHFASADGALVMICDRDPSKLVRAVAFGMMPVDLEGLVRTNDFIIGCTGQDPFAGVELDVASPTYFFSGSSKDAEFCSLTPLPNIILVNDGLPINFRHESLPYAIAEHLFLTLMFAIVQAKTNPAPGVAPLRDDLQRECNRIWLGARRYLSLSPLHKRFGGMSPAI